MPTYQYKCLACGHDFEMFQKMKDEPIKECPKCKGEVKRLLGPGAGPIFKGSGFYHTDYKKPKSDNKAIKPKPSDSKDN
jgi:putative FmdB family regulatory protein